MAVIDAHLVVSELRRLHATDIKRDYVEYDRIVRHLERIAHRALDAERDAIVGSYDTYGVYRTIEPTD